MSVRTCGRCGCTVQRAGKVWPKWCRTCGPLVRAQRDAARKASAKVPCAACGKPGTRAGRCSKHKRDVVLVPCPRCGQNFWPWDSKGKAGGASHARKFCGCAPVPKPPAPKPEPPTRACKWCRQEFRGYARYCGAECLRRATNQRKHLRRRGLRRKQEQIPLDEIYLRDAGTCGLCKRRVDRALRAPHRMSATLDHIVPIYRGGRHARENVQLAHYHCNSRKGARVGGQLRLAACS